MNNEVEWILEPWHLKVAFRKAGIHVPEKCIELPSKPIKGPNPNLESKVFCITVTVSIFLYLILRHQRFLFSKWLCFFI